MALTGLAIAAAMALAKDQLVDQPAAKRKRKLVAETQRLSPWTGMKAEAPDDPNTLGSMMQWGATGAQMGAGYEQQQADNGFKQAMTDRLNSGGSVGGSGWGGGYGKSIPGKDPTSNSLGGMDMSQKLKPKSSWGNTDEENDFWKSNRYAP